MSSRQSDIACRKPLHSLSRFSANSGSLLLALLMASVIPWPCFSNRSMKSRDDIYSLKAHLVPCLSMEFPEVGRVP